MGNVCSDESPDERFRRRWNTEPAQTARSGRAHLSRVVAERLEERADRALGAHVAEKGCGGGALPAVPVMELRHLSLNTSALLEVARKRGACITGHPPRVA